MLDLSLLMTMLPVIISKHFYHYLHVMQQQVAASRLPLLLHSSPVNVNVILSCCFFHFQFHPFSLVHAFVRATPNTQQVVVESIKPINRARKGKKGIKIDSFFFFFAF
jgi:Na+/phosphate symporter